MIGFKFTKLAISPQVKHLISYRTNGFSLGKFSSLNLSLHCGDEEKHVLQNRDAIATHFNLPKEKIYIPEQCHTNHIAVLKNHGEPYELKNTDGLITNQNQICLGVLSADCVPLLFHDSKKNVIAAVHAGWRGTVSLIQKNAVHLMSKEFGSIPKDIWVGIGPCISQFNYEVDLEIVNRFKTITADTSFISLNNNKGYIDLAQANKTLLVDTGIPESNIEIAGLCTYDKPDKFFSARRDGFHTGRFGAFIMQTKKPT